MEGNKPKTPERTPARHWSQFSLWSLLLLMTAVGPAACVVSSCLQPFVVLKRIHCGGSYEITLLAPSGFCDLAHPISYRFSGMASPASPPSFAFWSCGYSPEIACISAEGGNVVGIAEQDNADELLILVDFKNGVSWPSTPGRAVTKDAREMLAKLRRENGEIWLDNTSDGTLTKPRSR